MSKVQLSSMVAGLFFVLSLLFYVSVIEKKQQANKQKIMQIEKQIALDLPLLDLSNELLRHSGDKGAVLNYIKKLNTHINSDELTVFAISAKHEFESPLEPNQVSRTLKSNSGAVLVVFEIDEAYLTTQTLSFHFLFFVMSVLISFWLKHVFTYKLTQDLLKSEDQHTAAQLPLTLIIDLNNKTISINYKSDLQVSLANKPLCFYLALVEYCSHHSDILLYHSKNVPDELIELANKYFYRLVELGHTVRKRPNFNNSLEKTLSEIRAALDEVLIEYPDQKELYYPPKAYGEGSRSRLHSYALTNIVNGNVEILGK
ncbi:hypothetical protein [Pseudoalteromonas sp. MMG007]|uniref:hypothetical protein n=1 Tax=Pseudoalteromonas sp. MMG007 TaxID=2822684 RepID=UPI001B37277D|nr:hypothetical protein [Pseudoalteromonas sp. MMG007]MBQ4857659.1 hypothetical protein [Pseudoalteromonas sp. MMG007]